MKKKLIALLAAVAMVFSLAACGSTPDSVGTIGTVDITSGLYLLAQYDAYQKAADLAASEQDATDVKAFLKQTITVDADSGETATVSDYVSQKTMENLETYAAIETRFEELGGQLTAEEEAQADSYASQLMEQYGPDSYIGRVTAVMLGCSETTFYTVAVYYGAAGIRRTRHTIPAALAADAAAFIAAAWAVRVFFP